MKSTRRLGLAAVAVLALSAFSASSASAAQFLGEGKTIQFYGAQAAGQSNEWKIDGGNVSTCKTASYLSDAKLTPRKTLLLTPTFGECEILEYSEEASTFETNGCQFELLEPNVSLESNVAIRCPSGNSIRFYGVGFGECEALIGETGNTNLSKATSKNLGGSPSKFEVKIALSGITVDKKKDGIFCNLSGTGVVTNGVFNASVTIEDNGKTVGVSVG